MKLRMPLIVLCLGATTAACGDTDLLVEQSSLMANEKTLRSLPADDLQVPVYEVDQAIVLGQNKNTDKTVRAVILDSGLSTDASPRYHTYLTYFHGGEILNTSTAFDLGAMSSVDSTNRKRAGVYELGVTRLTDAGEQQRLITVDTTQVFVDDNEVEGEGNSYFSSSIKLSDESGSMKTPLTPETATRASSSFEAPSETLASIPTELEALVSVDKVARTIVLGRDNDATFRAVILDKGGSTDLSPRYHLYLTYFHPAEMFNSMTAFDLGAITDITAAHSHSFAIYELEVGREGDVRSTIFIDASAVLDQDETLTDQSPNYFQSSLRKTELAK